jgi:Ser-tRNA(Ala) deacylase AlaX
MGKNHIRYKLTKQHTVSHLILRYLWLTCVSYAGNEHSVAIIHRQHADDFVKVGIKLWNSERTVTRIFAEEVSLQHTEF